LRDSGPQESLSYSSRPFENTPQAAEQTRPGNQSLKPVALLAAAGLTRRRQLLPAALFDA
jgi:hypothetical protein